MNHLITVEPGDEIVLVGGRDQLTITLDSTSDGLSVVASGGDEPEVSGQPVRCLVEVPNGQMVAEVLDFRAGEEGTRYDLQLTNGDRWRDVPESRVVILSSGKTDY